jgi:Spy/CpxP family protein refolding chaperone
MASAKLILAAVFALTLSSGVVTGMLFSHLPASAKSSPGPVAAVAPAAKTPMEQALGLNSAQQEQMQKIWEHVRDTTDDCYLKAQDLQKEQWQAIVDLLTPEQKAQFSKVDAGFKAKFDDLKKKREAAFQQAVTDTDKLLDESQRTRFHDLIKTRVGRSLGDTPPWLNPSGGPDGGSATTQKSP